jgi:hypothetical protein
MLPWQLTLIKSSGVISRVRWLKITGVSGTISAPHNKGPFDDGIRDGL